ncbi:MAG: RNA 2',3'-cyclic phosphodiesterase [Candidatus Limnocylindria bacterium]
MTRGPRSGDPYAGVPGRRLFVALPLPGDAAAGVAAIVDDVRGQALPPGMHDVRWVRLDAVHLTLRFLGPTPEERIDPTAEAVAAVARRHAPIDLTIAGSGTFPAGPRPRTLWLGLTGGVDAVAALAGATSTALAAIGWPVDDRPFRPHLTLARSDGLAAGPLVARRLEAAMEGRSIDLTVDRMVLFESVTGAGPARYVPVAEHRLAATAPDAGSVYHPT